MMEEFIAQTICGLIIGGFAFVCYLYFGRVPKAVDVDPKTHADGDFDERWDDWCFYKQYPYAVPLLNRSKEFRDGFDYGMIWARMVDYQPGDFLPLKTIIANEAADQVLLAASRRKWTAEIVEVVGGTTEIDLMPPGPAEITNSALSERIAVIKWIRELADKRQGMADTEVDATAKLQFQTSADMLRLVVKELSFCKHLKPPTERP